MASITANHPKQQLLFWVVQEDHREDLDDAICTAVETTIENLARSGAWMIGPPEYVNQVDDESYRLVGGVHEIYSALRVSLPREVDLIMLDEVERIVQAVQKLSRDLSLEIEFELDGDSAGTVENGELDEFLSTVFLGEWRRHLHQE